MKSPTTRQLKVYQQYRSLSSGTRIVPELRLTGLWIEQLGFKIGDKVNITTRDRLLIIEPITGASVQEPDYKAALQAVKQTLKKLG